MFEIVFIAVITGYFLLTCLIVLHVKKKFPRLPEHELPSASVIVAARDEEANILRCLCALNSLEYPAGKLEIIIIDDGSTDRTAEIIATYIADKPVFKKIEVVKSFGTLKGKTNALLHALEIATGEVILTTDADCAVNPLWAKTLASYYTGKAAIVNGFTWQECRNSFEGMQSLDFVYLLLVAAGTTHAKMPISCIGNNMSYSRKAYNEAGGYESLPQSVTEDAQLLQAIVKLKKYDVLFPLDKDSLVVSLPCPNVKTLYRQKKRWAVGGLEIPWYAYPVLATSWLAHACFFAAPFFFSATVAAFLFFKVLLDYISLYLLTDFLGIKKILRYFPAFQAYFLLYVVLLPFTVAFSRKIAWKGRIFK